MNPWAILAVLLALAGYGGGCYYAGDKHATDACRSEKLEAERTAHVRYVDGVKRAIGQAEELASQDAEIEAASLQRQAKTARVFQTIDREVTRYVQTDSGRDLCFDDHGLRLYNAANRGEFPAGAAAIENTATAAGGVPKLAGGGQRLSGRDPGEPRLGGQGVSRLPGAAAGTGRAGEEARGIP